MLAEVAKQKAALFAAASRLAFVAFADFLRRCGETIEETEADLLHAVADAAQPPPYGVGRDAKALGNPIVVVLLKQCDPQHILLNAWEAELRLGRVEKKREGSAPIEMFFFAR